MQNSELLTFLFLEFCRTATNWRHQSDGSRSASGTDTKERWHQRNMAQMALTPRKDGWNSKTHLLSTQQRRTIDDIFIWDMSVLRCFTQFKSSDESSICKVGTNAKAVMAIYGDSAIQYIVKLFTSLPCDGFSCPEL